MGWLGLVLVVSAGWSRVGVGVVVASVPDGLRIFWDWPWPWQVLQVGEVAEAAETEVVQVMGAEPAAAAAPLARSCCTGERAPDLNVDRHVTREVEVLGYMPKSIVYSLFHTN